MTETKPKQSTEKPKRSRGRVIVTAGVVVICVAAVVMYFIPARAYVAGFGNILSANDAVLRAGSKGPVRAILVKSGDMVTNDQVILELESEVERSELLRCQRELEEEKAQLAYLKQSVEIARQQSEYEAQLADIKLSDAKTEYQRVCKLQSQQAASEREVQLADVQCRLAEAQYKLDAIDRSAAREATLQVQKRKIATLIARCDLARGTLARRQVRAPLAGVIVLHSLSIGQVVDANEILGQIFDSEYYQVVVRLPEKYAPLLKKGQEVAVELSAYVGSQPQQLRGRLYWVSPVVNPHGSGDGTILVKARLTDVPSPIKLKAGMSADVWVDVGQTRLLWKLVGLARIQDTPSQAAAQGDE